MDIELVTIGTELLLGFTIDTNGAEIARSLAAHGVRVVRRTSIADRAEDIRDAVETALTRTGAVITTGGLGPTRDDITKHVVADMFGWPLEFDDTVWEALLARFARVGRAPVASNRSQAEVPRGATVLPNQWGTAPGLWLEDARGLVVMLPGVPHEMRNLLAHEVVPRMNGRGGGTVIASRTVRTSGIAESTLAERLGDIEDTVAPLTLAYLPGVEGVDLRVTAWNLPAGESELRLDAGVAELRARAGEFVYGEGGDDLAALVVQRAREAGVRIAVAESCTGGLVGARLTAVPGSSDVFVGGVITYGDALKTLLLGVDPGVLAASGAVSEATAKAMADGARERLGADLAVSITGVAGPGGGTEAKPVGTVWLAIAGADAAATAVEMRFGGDRGDVRARSAQAALLLLLRRVTAHAR